MKRFICLMLVIVIVVFCSACGEETDYQKVQYSLKNADTNERDQFIDELEKTLANSAYRLYTGSSRGETEIVFYNVERINDTLKGTCRRIHNDGSSSDIVSFKYSNGKLRINLLSDQKISQGYTASTIDYLVADGFLLSTDSTVSNFNISETETFDLLISKYLKFSIDGTVKVKEYSAGGKTIFPENYYTGTYKKDGNVIICNTYCSETDYNNEWYMYIKDGVLYTDVYKKKQNAVTSNNVANDDKGTLNNRNGDKEKRSNIFSNNYENESNTNQHVHSYSKATCTEPAKCSCGRTTGSALGHQFSKATCTKPETCERCGLTRGNVTEHDFSGYGIQCRNCGAPNPNYPANNPPNKNNISIQVISSDKALIHDVALNNKFEYNDYQNTWFADVEFCITFSENVGNRYTVDFDIHDNNGGVTNTFLTISGIYGANEVKSDHKIAVSKDTIKIVLKASR